MKKIKLLTSLSTLAVVGSTVPFVTTSCNDKKDDEGTKEFTAISYNGVKIYDKNEPVSLVPTKLNIGTSTKYNADNFKATIGDSTEFVITKVTAKSNDKTVEINNASENSNFTVTGKAVGNADVEVTVEDANGDKATATIKFIVVNEPIYKISASEGTPENCIWTVGSESSLGTITFTEEAKTKGASGVKLSTSDITNPTYKFFIGDIEIIDESIKYDAEKGIEFAKEGVALITKQTTLTVKAFDGDDEKASATIYVDKQNLMTLADQNDPIELASDIDPNLFCNITTSTEFPLKNGKTTSNIDKTKITSLLLNSVSCPKCALDDNFMNGCTSLTEIDFSSCTSITSIGKNFMGGCTSLKSINFNGFNNVTFISSWFMSGCKALESADTTALTALTNIKDYFFNECYGLKSLDFSKSTNLIKVGEAFLLDCRSLESVDMGNIQASYMTVSAEGNGISFCVTDSTCSAYNPGINICGTYREDFRTTFKEATGPTYYRKLLNGGR